VDSRRGADAVELADEDLVDDDELDAAEADDWRYTILTLLTTGTGEPVDPDPVVPTVGAN
jgi:hypothetical protein